jgi:putative tricarboxylic transport membrane protein
LMVSQGSFLPVFTRPVSLILFLIIVLTVVSQFQFFGRFQQKIVDKLFNRKAKKAKA